MNIYSIRENLQAKLDILDPPHGLTLTGIAEASKYFRSLPPVQKLGLVEYMTEESKTFKNTEECKRTLETWAMLVTVNREQELEPLLKVIGEFAIQWQDEYLKELCIKTREEKDYKQESNQKDAPDQKAVS